MFQGLILILLNAALAASPATRWEAGEQLAREGKYTELSQLLQGDPPLQSSADFYNTGTLFLRAAQPGLALAYLEQAKRLAPGDSDIQENYRIAREAAGLSLGDTRLTAALHWTDEWNANFPLPLLQTLVSLLAAFFAMAALRAKAPIEAAALFAVIGLTILGIRWTATTHSHGIAIQTQSVRSGPGDSFIELDRIDPGIQIAILGPAQASKNQERWLQIRSPKGVGWIPEKAAIPLIRPGS